MPPVKSAWALPQVPGVASNANGGALEDADSKPLSLAGAGTVGRFYGRWERYLHEGNGVMLLFPGKLPPLP
jgi:hypothetical protein